MIYSFRPLPQREREREREGERYKCVKRANEQHTVSSMQRTCLLSRERMAYVQLTPNSPHNPAFHYKTIFSTKHSFCVLGNFTARNLSRFFRHKARHSFHYCHKLGVLFFFFFFFIFFLLLLSSSSSLLLLRFFLLCSRLSLLYIFYFTKTT